VFDFVSDPEIGLLLILELIPGESLLSILNREKKIPIELALAVGLDIARGLHDLHAVRIVHRDLKPGNVVLQPLGNGRYRAVLIDFGISRIVNASEDEEDEVTAITRAGTVLGTLEYIAPEQIFGSQTVTGTADLYALGAILYRAIVGQHAFVAGADAALLVLKMTGDAPVLPIENNSAVALKAQALVSRLLARDPAHRYQTAAEVATEIQAILGRALEETELPTGVHGDKAAAPQVEYAFEDSVEGADLAPALNYDEEDDTSAQITVDWDSESEGAQTKAPENTSDDELQTMFLPPRPFVPQRVTQPMPPPTAQANQPRAQQPASQQARQQPRQQVAQPAPQPTPQPGAQSLPHPAQQPPAPRSQWAVQTQPPINASQLNYPPPPPRRLPQSAIETVHIQAYRSSRSRWMWIVLAAVLAAFAGGLAAWFVLSRVMPHG
jgi:serine/threonine-protein kinase